jgi:hypothetical protein
MKTLSFAFAAALVLSAASPAFAQTPSQPHDTGSMAYPTPLPQGNVSTSTTAARHPTDTGSMNYPAPLPQGKVATTTTAARKPTDTGSMAYPAPNAAGMTSTTTVK